jgi:hypothetical protein
MEYPLVTTLSPTTPIAFIMRIDTTSITVVLGTLLALGAIFLSLYEPPPPPVKKVAPPDPHPNYYVRVKEASWGMNCDGQMIPSSSSDILKGKQVEQRRYEIRPGNATKTLQTLCDKKKKCSLTATVEDLGFDAAPKCTKDLRLTYTCFSYDKPWPIQVPEGMGLELDCTFEGSMKRINSLKAP